MQARVQAAKAPDQRPVVGGIAGGGRAIPSRGLLRLVVACLVFPVVTGCAPDPRDEAARLAADLSDGTFDTANLRDAPADPDAALAALLGDLAETSRAVRAGEPSTDRDSTTVPLTWTWDLGGVEWVVETHAELERGEATRWSARLVHPKAAPDSAFRLASVPAERGDLLAQDGTPIVTQRPVFHIGIDKAHLDSPDQAADAARELAARLGFDDVESFVERVTQAGPKAYVVAVTVRVEEEERWDVAGLRQVPGVLVQADEIPLAPTSAFARPLLGTVGQATAEIVAESQGTIRAGDMVGLAGLQRTYDAVLRGTRGVAVMLDGDELFATESVDGKDLVLTLSETLQLQAEGLLTEIDSASAIVAVRPSDGAILAAASGPGGSGLNTATVGLFAPGSTFKIATTLALLRAGLTETTLVPCTPTVTVDGRVFNNFPGYPAGSVGDIPLRDALAQSCNTAFIAQQATIGAAELAAAASSLGIGTSGTWPFPYATGDVPDAIGTAHAASLIGQGGVLVSPLAMAVAAASVAAGHTVVPVLVVGAEPDVAPPAVPLTSAEAETLRTMMRGVVETGTATSLHDLPGEPVGAKTGTAEYGSDGQTHAWMIACQGDLAVAVFVADGDSGAETAGPIMEAFLRIAEEYRGG